MARLITDTVLKQGQLLLIGNELYIVTDITDKYRYLVKEASWYHKVWWWICLR